jgi:hypothetical protein
MAGGLAGGRPGPSGGGASPASRGNHRAVGGVCVCAGEKRGEKNERRREARARVSWPSGPAGPKRLRPV